MKITDWVESLGHHYKVTRYRFFGIYPLDNRFILPLSFVNFGEIYCKTVEEGKEITKKYE